MLNEQQKIEAFAEACVNHANEGIDFGLDPMHVANVFMITAIKMVEELRGKAEAAAGLRLAAEQIENG